MRAARHLLPLAIVLGCLMPAVLRAQTPEVAVSGLPATPLIGEQFCVFTDFTNAGGSTGYGPYVIAAYDADVTVTLVAFVDVTPVIEFIGTFDASQTLIDPISQQPISGPENGSAYVVRYPIGSVDVGSGPLELEVCGQVGVGADVGVPLEVDVIPGFEFGNSPTGVNGPILNTGDTFTSTVIPQLARVEKTNTAPEGERPPGPSHEFAYNYQVDVSQLVALENLALTDTLPAEIQWTGDPPAISAPLGLGCAATTLPNPPNTAAGTLEVTCNQLVGTASTGDLFVTLPVYITDILNEAADDTDVLTNTVNLAYDYQATPYTDSDTSDVLALHAAIQKQVSGTPLPGNKLTYTINFQVTDYTAGAAPFLISDVLPDGLDFDATVSLTVNGVLTAVSPTISPGPGAGETTVVWDIAAANGGSIPTGARGQLRYQATVLDVYTDGVTPVQASDVLANTAALDYALGEGGSGANGSGAPATILPNTPDKSIADPNPLPPQLSPGQEITFRLSLDIPAGNTSSVVLKDLLPRPVFSVADFDPAADFTVLAPFQSLTPSVSTAIADNSVTFDFGSISSATPEILAVDLRARITAEPFADNLFLTNLLESSYQNAVGDTFGGLQAAAITVGAPELVITKGVIAVDNPGATITPTPPVDPSLALADSDASGADAFDVVTYLLTVENIGGQPAFAINVNDVGVPGQSCDGASVTAVNGNGTPLTFGGNITTGSGLTLDAPLAGNDGNPAGGGAPFGDDTALITLTCVVDAAVTPAQTVTSTSTVRWFSTASGGTAFPPRSDDASVTMARPSLAKTVIDVAPNYTGQLNRVHIGELVTYQLDITVPEGVSPDVQLEDRLDSGLAHVDVLSVTANSPALSSSLGDFDTAVRNNAGFLALGGAAEGVDQRLVFGPTAPDNGFGTVTNADSDNGSPEVISLVYRTRVLNAAANVRGQNRNNRARWIWQPTDSGRQTAQASAANVRIVEPDLRVTRTFLPDTGDEFSPPQVRITAEHTGASNADTFDVELVERLPEELLIAGGTGGVSLSNCPAVDSINIVQALGQRLQIAWLDFPENNGPCVIEFQTTVDGAFIGTIAGETLQGCSRIQYQSLSAADQPLPGTPNNNLLAVERTGDVNDPGGGANTYIDESCDNFRVFDVGVVKDVSSTSEPQTDSIPGTPPGFESLTIGEVVTFELVLTLPDSLATGLRVTDLLPNVGVTLELLSASVTSVGSELIYSPGGSPVSGAPPVGSISDGNGDGVDDQVLFDFGDVNKSVINGITEADRIRIAVTAKVRDLAGNTNNALDANGVVVLFGPAGSVTDSADIEIVEPLLEVEKTADLTEVEAGDLIIYTVTTRHGVNSRVAAQQVAVTDALPAQLTLVPGSVQLGELCTQPPDSGPTETANGFSAAWDSFDLGAICEITMQARVDIAALTGERIVNSADLAWTSLSTTGDPDDRNYDAQGSWEVVVSPPGLSKELTGTDQASTRFLLGSPSSELTIGETATFELVAEFPDGTTRLVVVEDRLPTTDVALAITRAEVIRVGGDLSLGSGIGVGDSGGLCSPPLASCSRFVLDTVVNQPDSRPGSDDSEDSVVFEIDAIVLDDPRNSGAPGEDKGQLNEVRLLSPDANLIATEPFDIVEPQLSVQKLNDGASTGVTRAGAKEQFVLRITHTPESTATARAIQITDVLDSNMFGQDPLAPDFEAIASNCPGFSVVSEPITGASSPDFVFSFDALTLALGSCEVSYAVDMSPTLPVSGEYANTVTLAWQSAPGSPQTRNYSVADSVRLFSFNDATVSKAVRITSLPETGAHVGDPLLDDLTIGEIVEFEIVATFAEGTTTANVEAGDAFQVDANGVFEFVDGTVDFVGSNISFTGPGVVDDPLANPLTIPYGSVTNLADGVLDANDTIRYTLRLRVAVDPRNSDDGSLPLQQLSNTGSLDFDSGTPRNVSDTVAIEVVEPILGLTKTFGDVEDGVATIELTLANTGNAPAFDVVASDDFDETIWVPGSLTPVQVPQGFELVESSAAGVTTVTLQVASPSLPPSPEEYLAPGRSASVVFAMALQNNGQPVDGLGDPVTTVPNTATVVASSLPGDLPDQNDPDPEERSYSLAASDDLLLPALVFEKTWTAPGNPGNSPAEPGQTVTYTLTVANTGAAPLTEVVITDTPDTVRGLFDVGSVAITAGGNSDAGSVVSGNTAGDTDIEVTFTQIDAGVTVTVNYDVRIPFPYPDPQAASQRLVNQATLASRELPDRLSDDPTTAAPDDATVVPIEADPVMTIQKTDNGAVGTAGSVITYDITVGNAGNQNASGVEVTETVPANTTFVPSLSTRTWRCTGVTAGSTCTYDLFDVPVGTSQLLQFVVAVDNPLAAGVTQIDNTAVVVEDGAENPDNPNPPLLPGPPSTAADSDTTPIIALPILGVVKDDGDIAVAPADRYVYRIQYENIGNQDATNVLLTESVPDFVVFDAALSTPGWSCADGSTPGTLCVLDLGTVSPGAPGFVDFGLRVVFPAPAGAELIVNTVEIEDDGSNSGGIVLTDSDDDATPLIAVPDMVINKVSDAGTVRIDQVVTYAIRYDNAGNQNATGVIVRERVPQGARYAAAASAPTPWSCADGATGGTVCNVIIGNLNAGDGGDLTFAVEVVAQTDDLLLTNIAETNDDGSNGLDPTPDNNITRVLDNFPVPSIPALPALLLWLLAALTAVVGAHRRMRGFRR